MIKFSPKNASKSIKKLLACASGCCIVALSLSGCGETADYFTEMQKIDAITEYDYQADFTLSAEEMYLTATLEGTVVDDACSTHIVLNIPEMQAIDTTAIIANDTLYLDTSKLGIDTGSAWVSLPFSSVSEMTEDKVDAEDIGNIDETGTALYDAGMGLLQSITSQMKTSPLGKDGDTFTLTIDNAVLEDLFTAVKTSIDNGDVDKFVNTVASEAAKYDETADITSQWSEKKASIVSALDEVIEKLSDGESPDEIKFNSSVKADDKSFVFRNKASYSNTASDENYEIMFNFAKYTTVSEIVIPTEAGSLEDLLQNMLGGLLGGLDSGSYDGFDIDIDTDTDYSGDNYCGDATSDDWGIDEDTWSPIFEYNG